MCLSRDVLIRRWCDKGHTYHVQTILFIIASQPESLLFQKARPGRFANASFLLPKKAARNCYTTIVYPSYQKLTVCNTTIAEGVVCMAPQSIPPSYVSKLEDFSRSLPGTLAGSLTFRIVRPDFGFQDRDLCKETHCQCGCGYLR